MGQIFKKGDRVFCYQYGWGQITKIHSNNVEFPILVHFPNVDEDISFTNDGEYDLNHKPTLSFTEYTLEGFSQERPEELPKPGDIVWVRDREYDNWMITYFRKFGNGELRYGANPRNSGDSADTYYYRFLTTINPYANEHN